MHRDPPPPSSRHEAAQALLRRLAPEAARGALRESIPTEIIESNPWQPTDLTGDEGMASFVESVRVHGVHPPVMVRRLAGGRVQLLVGVRRLEAAKVIGARSVPATVVDVDDAMAIVLTLTEALLRGDLTSWEEAERLTELRKTLQELGQPADLELLGKVTGRSERWITDRLFIAERVTADVIRRSGRRIHDMTGLPAEGLLSAARKDTVEARALRLREVVEAAERDARERRADRRT